MKGVVALLLGVVCVAAIVARGPAMSDTATAAGAEPQARGIGEQLRYIGRDQLTGMPAPVDDRFIAEVERAVERYGKDERAAVPPPPLDGPDVASLAIPKLGIDASVRRFGLDRFGRLDVPQDARTIGWNPAYTDLPGAGGETFFAAHFEYLGVPGVFSRLSTLVAGDEVTVRLSDGSTYTYRVTSTVDYPLGAIDMGALLFGREGVEAITLMTCSGPANEGEYALRTVVLAERVTG
jgi:LPXTG-site transpeptidase (sortase) family protein